MTSSFGIDSMKFKHTKAPIVVLDLLTAEGERLWWQYLNNSRVIGAWTWMAPPCGTSSKAREIANGGPRPLRSDAEPDGLCGLGSNDRLRVDTANALYRLTTKIISFCFCEGLFFFVENPFSSIYWKTTAFRSIEQFDKLFFQSHVALRFEKTEENYAGIQHSRSGNGVPSMSWKPRSLEMRSSHSKQQACVHYINREALSQRSLRIRCKSRPFCL